ncbi:PEP-CTERM sorting domain-containing protein [Sphingomonas sp. ID1715]|uniref:PEPxxWA-CTERM sorting domain-containing protein n=1 Tax=Sphingomonas sp. ID1715 TaxID=1656898 RepID=UPI001488C20D|nr:PEPxxWA-CTERM sorting domain-containing protein [Sphingomonas sp. ID1715]NNM76598.1 PEP-CTERM sorting domain-containing protein [Sphingomonas sp. ID1715]
MRIKLALATAALALALPGSAEAAYQINSYNWAPGSLTGTIKYTPTNLSLNVGIGRFRLNGTDLATGKATSFLTYCVDIFHTLQPAVFDFASVSTLVPNATKQNQLLTLLAHADPLIALSSNKAETAAAVQLAVWEIANETGPTYDFATGTFRSSGGNSDGARALATSYLGKVTSGAWAAPTGQLKLLYSPNSQSQLLSSVPEPATWSLMIGGLGVVGGMARRRSARTRIVLA